MKRILSVFLLCFCFLISHSQRQKKFALEWLSKPEIIEDFGMISDQIWNFAELGLQEFKSSALLINTLQQEGFTIEKGLAGMPTCFVASYGSGKPVIGILAEYDALPMISQKPQNIEQNPLVEGAPGHGCGHNLMGTAASAAAIATKKAMEKIWFKRDNKSFRFPRRRNVG